MEVMKVEKSVRVPESLESAVFEVTRDDRRKYWEVTRRQILLDLLSALQSIAIALFTGPFWVFVGLLHWKSVVFWLAMPVFVSFALYGLIVLAAGIKGYFDARHIAGSSRKLVVEGEISRLASSRFKRGQRHNFQVTIRNLTFNIGAWPKDELRVGHWLHLEVMLPSAAVCDVKMLDNTDIEAITGQAYREPDPSAAHVVHPLWKGQLSLVSTTEINAIAPVLMPKSWNGFVREAVAWNPWPAEMRMDFDVAFAYKDHNELVFVYKDDLRAFEESEIFDIAMKNLEEIPERYVEVQLTNGKMMLVLGDGLRNEKLLSKRFLEKMAAKLGASTLLISIPRHTLFHIIAADASPEALSDFIAIHRKELGDTTSPHLQLSSRLLVVKDGMVTGVYGASGQV
jgi:hypothetical protein